MSNAKWKSGCGATDRRQSLGHSIGIGRMLDAESLSERA